VRIVCVFQTDRPLFAQNVFDLFVDLLIIQIGKKAEAALCDTHGKIS
jgi:hypothetical protein